MVQTARYLSAYFNPDFNGGHHVPGSLGAGRYQTAAGINYLGNGRNHGGARYGIGIFRADMGAGVDISNTCGGDSNDGTGFCGVFCGGNWRGTSNLEDSHRGGLCLDSDVDRAAKTNKKKVFINGEGQPPLAEKLPLFWFIDLCEPDYRFNGSGASLPQR